MHAGRRPQTPTAIVAGALRKAGGHVLLSILHPSQGDVTMKANLSNGAVAASFQRVMSMEELRAQGLASVQVGDRVVALVLHEDQVYAVDNRCPHMGFPLDKGSVHNGILTCHWHHARFDLQSGGAFDLWADDVPSFPVTIHEGDVWVDVATYSDAEEASRQRLRMGLERNLSLVIGKSAILLEERGNAQAAIEAGLAFGCEYRQAGWGQGLTILGCMVNLLSDLDKADRPRALFHGLSAVADDTAGAPYRYVVRPLPDPAADRSRLKAWFRQFIEVRDAEGAERCLVSAIQGGADPAFLMDMLGAAATDRRYIDMGHPMDFTNKAFQILDRTRWQTPERVLTSLVQGMAMARRMEESNAWRAPVDLIELLGEAFEALDAALATGAARRDAWNGDPALVADLLALEPADLMARMLDALRAGMPPDELALHVCFAAATRIAQFHTSNEIADWDTALHTFTFSNAVMQAYRRAPSTALLRGVFDAAMSVHLDRFLNIPAARLPTGNAQGTADDDALDALGALLDHQYQVTPSAEIVAAYAVRTADYRGLRARLGRYLLREDRDFHTIQCVEAAFALHDALRARRAVPSPLNPDVAFIAAARYLAAHAPTMRAQGQTYDIALRLHRGDRMFEG